MPSWLTLKLGGMILGGLAALSFVLLALHWKHQAADRGEKLAVICSATRDASGQPKLKCSEVPKQIQFMGEAISTLSGAIAKQNAAVDALGKETARQQGEAAQASQVAAGRARAAQATSERLKASSRSGGPVCEPSAALKGAWQ